MSLIKSLASGSSSLKANTKRFDVISNNIANSNTIGFKSSRTTFMDEFSQTVKFGSAPTNNGANGFGGIDPSQIGLGVQIGAIQTDMGQGVLETTNRPLDMALNGEGYFVYNVNGTQEYSRSGTISQDTNGTLVDASTGAILQGYSPLKINGDNAKDSNGNNVINRKLGNLQIPKSTISEPNQTKKINLKGNLDTAMATGDTRPTSIGIFDNTGGSHDLQFIFTKTKNLNEYTLTSTVDGKAVNVGGLASTTVTFNPDGTLKTPDPATALTVATKDLNKVIGTPGLFDETKDISVSLADPNNLSGGSLTNRSQNSDASFDSQDGYAAGNLTTLNVNQNGTIIGSFTNGRSEILGQVVMAKFTNQEGLTKAGNNFYKTSPDSGLANIGTAGETFASTSIKGGALEQSNVDLTDQFTDIIATQRAFEAASRTITVSDQLLQEVNSLKR